jgi:menaquinone-specific isochorismate synthase
MITDNKVRTFEDVIAALKTRADQEEGTKIGFALHHGDPFELYQSIKLFPKAFFYSPKTKKTTLFLGHAKHCENVSSVHYGGIAFPSSSESEEWQAYGKQSWFVPIVRIIWDYDSATVKSTTGQDLDDFINAVTFVSEKHDEALTPLAYKHSPTKSEWQSCVEEAQRKIESGDIAKVVLARKTTLTFDSSVSVINVLKTSFSDPINHYVFHLQLSADDAWLSLSPELLFYRKQQHVTSDALAGTRPRGESEEEDRDYQEKLEKSEKDIQEHRFVKDMILERFQALCVTPPKETPLSILKLRNVQHLHSSISGILKEDVRDKDIIGTLFPTPAVAGTPTTNAIAMLSELEPFDRGWYAGAMGVLSRDESECIVGIRSVRIKGNTLSFYAGAGIVAQSNWENEWEEINSKLNIFMSRISNVDIS